MARSRITEDQVNDTDFASELEMMEYVSTVSGSLRSYIDTKSPISHTHDDRYYIKSTVDYLISTVSGTNDPTVSGISTTVNQYFTTSGTITQSMMDSIVATVIDNIDLGDVTITGTVTYEIITTVIETEIARKSIQLPLYVGKDYYYSTNSLTFVTAVEFIFMGTDLLGSPREALVSTHIEKSGETGYVRLYDATNDSVLIDWTTTSTADGNIEEVTSSGFINNFPRNKAALRILIKSSNTNNDAQVSALLLQF